MTKDPVDLAFQYIQSQVAQDQYTTHCNGEEQQLQPIEMAKFELHLKKALALIYEIYQKPNVKYALTFNGGKDCTLLLYLLLRMKFAMKALTASEEDKKLLVLYIQTENSFPEIEDFINELSLKYSKDMTLLRKDGTLKHVLKDYCGYYLFMGTRRSDPFSSQLGYCSATDSDWPSLVRVMPLLDWSYHEVWFLLIKSYFPICKLYRDGYTSLGNISNTRRNPRLAPGEPAWKLLDESEERLGRISATH